MTISISANPGQTVTFAVQVINSTGALQDGYQAPTVDFILTPSGAGSAGYPIAMTEVAGGVFIHSVTIPSGSTGLGTYVASCSWPHPDTSVFQNELVLIHAFRAFGNSSVAPA